MKKKSLIVEKSLIWIRVYSKTSFIKNAIALPLNPFTSKHFCFELSTCWIFWDVLPQNKFSIDQNMQILEWAIENCSLQQLLLPYGSFSSNVSAAPQCTNYCPCFVVVIFNWEKCCKILCASKWFIICYHRTMKNAYLIFTHKKTTLYMLQPM